MKRFSTLIQYLPAGAVIIALTAPPGTDFRARGERFGQGVGPFAIVIGVIVYFRQAARIRRDREPPRAQVR